MRKKVIAGNWKMNKLPNEAIDFIDRLTPLVKDTKNEVVVCVCTINSTRNKHKNRSPKYAL